MNYTTQTDHEMTRTPATAKTPRGVKRRSSIIPPEWQCPTCGEELCIFAHGRAWCIVCDERELFGEGSE